MTVWRLWRQDDNGNRFLVGEFSDAGSAEARMAELARYPHKQTYWLEPLQAVTGSETK